MYKEPKILEYKFKYSNETMYIEENMKDTFEAFEDLIYAQKNYTKDTEKYHKMANNARDQIGMHVFNGGDEYLELLSIIKSDEAYVIGNSLAISEKAFSILKENMKRNSQFVETTKAVVSEIVEVYGSAVISYGLDIAVSSVTNSTNAKLPSPKEFFSSPKSAKKVISYLQALGFEIESQTGSHVKLTKDNNTAIVPNHGSKDMAIGTLKSVMKQAGLK